MHKSSLHLILLHEFMDSSLNIHQFGCMKNFCDDRCATVIKASVAALYTYQNERLLVYERQDIVQQILKIFFCFP